ncbi:MAG: hypothetical protein WCK08_13785 [Betaproteobacteria bacterium]
MRLNEVVEVFASVNPDVMALGHTATNAYLGEDREAALCKDSRKLLNSNHPA